MSFSDVNNVDINEVIKIEILNENVVHNTRVQEISGGKDKIYKCKITYKCGKNFEVFLSHHFIKMNFSNMLPINIRYHLNLNEVPSYIN